MRESLPPDALRSLLALVHEYVETCVELADLVAAEYGQRSLAGGWRSGAIPREGQTRGGIRFEFHGNGCVLTIGNISVDFDFLPQGGSVGTIDAARLGFFFDDHPSKVGVFPSNLIQAGLDQLVLRGELVNVSSGFYALPGWMGQGWPAPTAQ